MANDCCEDAGGNSEGAQSADQSSIRLISMEGSCAGENRTHSSESSNRKSAFQTFSRQKLDKRRSFLNQIVGLSWSSLKFARL